MNIHTGYKWINIFTVAIGADMLLCCYVAMLLCCYVAMLLCSNFE